jgi:hypothetical protein
MDEKTLEQQRVRMNFSTNVKDNKPLESFKKKLNACETREAVQKLVNQYT